jgi:hypothetical protein
LSLAEPAARIHAPTAVESTGLKLAPLVLIAWAAVTVSALLGGAPTFTQMETDDYMRLVEVRDFLAGQGWFDLTQYRLDPPAGVVMHWSRIVDVPIAFLIQILTPLTGRANAEWATATLWPVFLFLPTLALVGLLARRLAFEHAGIVAPLSAVLLVAVAGPVLVHFHSGALDHHNLQLLLLMVTITGAAWRGDARLVPALGGLAAAASIAIGLEMMPALAAILAAVGLRWAIEGEDAAPLTSAFGLAFGVGTIALFVATVPPSNWTNPAYDEISIVWMAVAAISGGMIALLAAASRRLRNARLRLAIGALAGLLSAGLVIAAYPHALTDPYSNVDPLLAELWIAHIMEMRSVLEVLKTPSEALPIYLPPIAALILGGLAMCRSAPKDRTLFLAPLFALVALIAVSLWQLRAMPGANLVAQPILAGALLRLLGFETNGFARARYIGAIVLVSSPFLILAGPGLASIVNTGDKNRPADQDDVTCRLPADVAALNRLAPGLVLSFIDSGPAILAATPHTVLAAPFHRNNDGNKAAYDVFLSSDGAAERILKERHVSYVAFCLGTTDLKIFNRAAPDGLAMRLARGEVPPYLEPIPGDPAAPLRVFRVR